MIRIAVMSLVPTLSRVSEGLPLRGLRVEVIRGPDAGKTFTATSDTISVGTAPTNDLVLTDETVSRYHLELQRQGDRILVTDHQSTNRTLFGVAQVERIGLPPGNLLTLGDTKIRVDDDEPLTLELHDDDHLGPLLGRGSEMRGLMARIKKLAQSDVSLLVLGETGSGKEVVAHAVHQSSARATAPFETVDCGALLPTLIASELFGHEAGAFTGADRRHIGAFERAQGGTVFLDEIGELPPALQTNLLGVLERRTFRRLGGQSPISVDVRVIAATNRDLRAEVNLGRFRQDLYYRLAVVMLRVPPLRERAGDIELLVEHFLEQAGFDGDPEEIIPASALNGLKAHHWPGNVRELRNFVEAALALGELPQLEGEPAPAAGAVSAGEPDDPSRTPYSEARAAVLAEFEQRYLGALMARTRGNVSLASRESKMNRQHLTRILKRLGIK